jgi:soluble lytic murein transglycosylase
LASSKGQGQYFHLLVADRLTQIQDWADLVKWADRHFEKPAAVADLTNITARYHYPLVYRESVMRAAREFDLSPFLIWGLMREESRFEDGAVSRVGAIGLMQIMPSLGDRIGRTLGEGPTNRKRLADPKRNIRYGAFHIKELEKAVDRLSVPSELKPVLIVASYNAGIEAVQRWLKEKDPSSLDLFVDSISFSETRTYVKRVLQSAYIYYQLYGDRDKEVARTKGKQDL